MSQYKLFKGTNTEYRTLHQWVEKQLGKPMWCWNCLDRSKTRYHWANRSNRYEKNIFDWQRLCVPCHVKFDAMYRSPTRRTSRGIVDRDVCKYGHKLTPDNVYMKPSSSGKQCVTCRKDMRARWEASHRDLVNERQNEKRRKVREMREDITKTVWGVYWMNKAINKGGTAFYEKEVEAEWEAANTPDFLDVRIEEQTYEPAR